MPPNPKTPRTYLGNQIRLRLEDLGLSIGDFAEKLAKKLKTEHLKCHRFVNHVLAGRKVVPKASQDIWAGVLGWPPGAAEYQEFAAMIEAARAWGKLDGRGHIARLESDNRDLRRQLAKVSAQLETQARAIAALRGSKVRGSVPGPDEPETLRLPDSIPGK